jgi:DNA polymerase III delta subunit
MPLTLLTGEDSYRLQRRVRELRTQWVDSTLGDLGYKKLTQPDLPTTYEALLTVSFNFGSLPVVELVSPWWCHETPEGKHDEASLKQLLDILPDAAEQKNILLIATPLDKKLKAVKQLLKLPQLTVESFDLPPWWDHATASQRLITACQELGITIAPSAAKLLCEALGHHLLPLINECQRLHTLTQGGTLTDALIKRHITLPNSHFDIIRAWLNPSPLSSEHWQSLQNLLATEDPIRFLGLIGSQLKSALMLKSLLATGATAERIAKERFPNLKEADIGKKAFGIRKNEIEPLAACTLNRLNYLQDCLIETHLAIKTGQTPAIFALEYLFTK